MTRLRSSSLSFILAFVIPTADPAQAGQAPPAEGDGQTAQAGPKVVEEGVFPKSIKIPGTDLSLGIGGYVKVDFIQDFSGIGDAYEFKTNSIPVEGSSAAEQSGRTTIHARETRFNLDLRSNGTGRHRFRAFVEGDFFGDNNAFRLRHGYGEFGPLLGGQTWSTFQDISARGLTIDFEGPDGEVFVRQAMIRFTHTIDANWTVAVAAENPSPQFAVPGNLAGSARAAMPDIPGYVRYQRGSGHVQVAGLVRQLRFDSTSDAADDTATVGWGLNTTFVLPIRAGYQLLGQFAIGEGTGRYIEGLSGQNLDALLSSTGSIQGIRTQSGNLGYIHTWSATVKSGLNFSTSYVEDDAALPSTAIDRLMDVRGNLIWTPYRLVDIGGELLWGERRNKNGASGDAWRFQFAVIYRLS
jgi:DcaP outer membrane protein